MAYNGVYSLIMLRRGDRILNKRRINRLSELYVWEKVGEVSSAKERKLSVIERESGPEN